MQSVYRRSERKVKGEGKNAIAFLQNFSKKNIAVSEESHIHLRHLFPYLLDLHFYLKGAMFCLLRGETLLLGDNIFPFEGKNVIKSFARCNQVICMS